MSAERDAALHDAYLRVSGWTLMAGLWYHSRFETGVPTAKAVGLQLDEDTLRLSMVLLHGPPDIRKHVARTLVPELFKAGQELLDTLAKDPAIASHVERIKAAIAGIDDLVNISTSRKAEEPEA